MKKAQPSKMIEIVIVVIALCMAIYHLVSAKFLIQGPIEHQNIHLMLSYLLVFLGALKKKGSSWPFVLPLLLASIIGTVYIQYFYSELEIRIGLPNSSDKVISIFLLVTCFAGSIYAVGKVLPIVTLIFVAYVIFGHYLPRPFWHFPVSLNSIAANYNMGFHGMYGFILGASANYLFLIVLFGALLNATGATQFFMEVGKVVGRKFAGGAGLVAIVSSALVGTVSGSGAANVAITAPFTVPMMKKAGYSPEQAAGIETVASAGGHIMPPMMGIGAFLMSEYTRIPYIRVCMMFIIPAILYYLCLSLYAELNARKFRVKAPYFEKLNVRLIKNSAPQFLVSLSTMVVTLMVGYSLTVVAFNAIVALIVVSLIRKETRGSLSGWVKGCVDGACLGAAIGVTCALIGIIIASVNMTGIGLLLPALVEELSKGILILGLLMIACITIILGAGLPPVASYLIVAILAVPALIKMGVPFEQAHVFSYFFAVFALITPPVALTAVLAAPIAGASYLKTSFQAVRAGIVAWLLPFLVIWCPGIILKPMGFVDFIITLMVAFTAVLFLQITLVSYYFVDLNYVERSLSAVCSVAFITFLFTKNYVLLAVGFTTSVLITVWQLRRRKLIEHTSDDVY